MRRLILTHNKVKKEHRNRNNHTNHNELKKINWLIDHRKYYAMSKKTFNLRQSGFQNKNMNKM